MLQERIRGCFYLRKFQTMGCFWYKVKLGACSTAARGFVAHFRCIVHLRACGGRKSLPQDADQREVRDIYSLSYLSWMSLFINLPEKYYVYLVISFWHLFSSQVIIRVLFFDPKMSSMRKGR